MNGPLVGLLGRIAPVWPLAHKPWVGPIPSTTEVHRPDETLAAFAVPLTPDGWRDVNEAAAPIALHHARCPERLQGMTGR